MLNMVKTFPTNVYKFRRSFKNMIKETNKKIELRRKYFILYYYYYFSDIEVGL